MNKNDNIILIKENILKITKNSHTIDKPNLMDKTCCYIDLANKLFSQLDKEHKHDIYMLVVNMYDTLSKIKSI